MILKLCQERNTVFNYPPYLPDITPCGLFYSRKSPGILEGILKAICNIVLSCEKCRQQEEKYNEEGEVTIVEVDALKHPRLMIY